MIKAAATAFALSAVVTGVGGVMSPANATSPAEGHCEGHNSSENKKVEIGYETTKLKLKPGMLICVKAGNFNSGKVVVPESGYYHQNFAYNKKGKKLGISYYVIYKACKY